MRPWEPSPDNNLRAALVWPEEETMETVITLYKVCHLCHVLTEYLHFFYALNTQVYMHVHIISLHMNN